MADEEEKKPVGLPPAILPHTPLTDAEKDAGYTVVKLGKKGKNRIFWERDRMHPRKADSEEPGEALVVDGRCVKVYETPRVGEAIGRGLLMRAKPSDFRAPPPDIAETLDHRAIAEAVNAQAETQFKSGAVTAKAVGRPKADSAPSGADSSAE